jgi:hypothetical protein
MRTDCHFTAEVMLGCGADVARLDYDPVPLSVTEHVRAHDGLPRSVEGTIGQPSCRSPMEDGSARSGAAWPRGRHLVTPIYEDGLQTRVLIRKLSHIDDRGMPTGGVGGSATWRAGHWWYWPGSGIRSIRRRRGPP